MSTPLFDSYIAVDWSAAAVPRRGRDSIWIAAVRRDDAGRARRTLLENPATRADATDHLIALARAGVKRGARTLIGFDFPFGYPAGTAAALGLAAAGGAWRATWDRIDGLLRDGADNANNRFDVGATLNAEISGEAFPFWGCPAGKSGPMLRAKGRRPHAPGEPAERRLCESRVRTIQPVWKLAYTGSVGGQALTGIPRVRRIRDDAALRATTRIWPFETGLADDPAAAVILAELYPSLVDPVALPGRPKDAGQVVATATALAARDADGTLGDLLAGDPGLTAEERAAVVGEEAWILGVTDRPSLNRPHLDGGRRAA